MFAPSEKRKRDSFCVKMRNGEIYSKRKKEKKSINYYSRRCRSVDNERNLLLAEITDRRSGTYSPIIFANNSDNNPNKWTNYI